MSIGPTGSALGSLLGQYGNTISTAANPYSLAQQGYTVPPPPPPPPPFPYTHPEGCVGIFRMRKIENGYMVEYQLRAGEQVKEYYAESLKDAGERIAALGVQKALEGEPQR